MTLADRWSLVRAGLVLALTGPASADCPRPSPPPLPPTVRGAIEPEVGSLPAVAAESLPPFLPPLRYRLLREGDAPCRAAEAASVTRDLESITGELLALQPST